MPDIHDVEELQRLESEIQQLNDALNDALEKQAEVDKLKIDADKSVTILKNDLKQKNGERDSLKKILSILPR